MIFVDLYVPSLDKTYNFRLNEKAAVHSAMAEMTAMIEQKERTKLVGDIEEMVLCDKEKQAVLPPENTLAGCEVRTGSCLILV